MYLFACKKRERSEFVKLTLVSCVKKRNYEKEITAIVMFSERNVPVFDENCSCSSYKSHINDGLVIVVIII